VQGQSLELHDLSHACVPNARLITSDFPSQCILSLSGMGICAEAPVVLSTILQYLALIIRQEEPLMRSRRGFYWVNPELNGIVVNPVNGSECVVRM
jgi:hypothetical protein